MATTVKEYTQLEKATGIKEVFAHNFIEEIKKISLLLEKYHYIGMDTEFPGIVYNVTNYTNDFYYKTIKLNVDNLHLIQLGITLTDKEGNYPSDIHTWQFNLFIDTNTEKFNHESFNLLVNCGIDFNTLKSKGISQSLFAEYFLISGLVLNPEVHWISFHGSYDFGYLLKACTNLPLPDTEEQFAKELALYFPNHYDIKILTLGNVHLHGGLNKLAQILDVFRVGKTHQAGSDSIVTIDVFFKLIKNGILNEDSIEDEKNIIYGIGLGADNTETITYTKIGNSYMTLNSSGMLVNNANEFQNIYASFGNNYRLLGANFLKNIPMHMNNNISHISNQNTIANNFYPNNVSTNQNIQSCLNYNDSTYYYMKKNQSNQNNSEENSKNISY